VRDCFLIPNKLYGTVQSGTITEIGRLNIGFENLI
jgi:hypothetical protein